MRARIDPSDELLALAAGQAGVVSLGQTAELGLPPDCVRRLVDQGHWQRVTPGIFHLGPGEPTWLARAWIGILLGGPHARLGFAAAGHVWNVVEEPPDDIAVLVPPTRQVAPRDGWTFPRERAGVRPDRSRAEPPRTTEADTVVDLCAVADDAEVVDLITKAVQRRMVTPSQLLRCVEGRRRLANRTTMIALLADVAEGAESPLELKYVHDVEQAHGLPTAQRQQRSRSGREVRDALYEEYSTVVELDGKVHAFGKLRDMRRDNRSLLDGFATLRYGWPDVSGSPCQVAWQVAAVLIARGWQGRPERCYRCRDAADADLWLD